MTEVVDLTRRLVSIPSHEGEVEVGDVIETWLSDHTDAKVTRDETGNVVARRGGDGPSLALVGHHDVVPPSESQVVAGGHRYTVEERDGRLYGRGTADMKGSLAAAMLAFRDADLSGVDDPDRVGELVFASFVGEEDGGVGARAAIDDGFVPDYAVVGEGSTGYSAAGVTDVAVAHKGRRASRIEARGEAAHASEPEAGENAIYSACDAIEIVRNVDFPEVEVLGQPVRGSVAVTEIDGGSAWNVIPEGCEVTIDERTVPGRRTFFEAVEELEGVGWHVEQDLPPMECDDPDFADAVLDAARSAQEHDPQHVVKPHATDAGWLAEAGTTCVICGASEPGEAHTEDESVSVEVVERCYEIYRRTAEEFGG